MSTRARVAKYSMDVCDERKMIRDSIRAYCWEDLASERRRHHLQGLLASKRRMILVTDRERNKAYRSVYFVD
jgi:hypothetical protein